MALMTDVHSIQENFTNLIRRANTPALAKFIVWLDMKVAEYKVNGFMSLDQQVTIKPRWMQEADEESAIQNHKRKVCEFFNQDVRQCEGDRNNGSSVSNKDEVSVDLECSQTPAESLCKRKKAEDGNHSPRSQENARLTDNTESTETQQKRSDENNCETVVKEEVIDLDYEDSIHSSHAARCYSDVSERNNTFLDQSIKSKKTSYSSLPSQDTQSNTSRLSVSENRVFLSPPSSQSVSQGNLTFLPREGRIQKSNSLEQLTNKKFSSVSQPTRERTAMPSSTVTSKSVSSSFSNDNYMEEPAYTRTEESDIALCMKVESVDEDLGDDLEMHELHESELNDIRGLKTTYFAPNSVININERLDAGGFDPASFGTPSFRGENSSFQVSQQKFLEQYSLNLTKHRSANRSLPRTTPRRQPGDLYSCGQCNRGFTTKTSLNNHEKTDHKLEFKYTCSVCHRRFNGLSTYKDHMVTHDIISRQGCSMCGEKFELRKSLMDHMATAHGYTEIKCQTCEQRFTSHDALREHTAAMHEGRVFSCKFCGKQFKWRSSFNYHTKKCSEQFLY
ncbi:hypothetical protein ScPMuIL_011776 [Solemya velum]